MRLTFLFVFCASYLWSQEVHFRFNILGYHPQDNKVALMMSEQAIHGKVELVSIDTGEPIAELAISPANSKAWGAFHQQYLVDFSQIETEGIFYLRKGKATSAEFQIGTNLYIGTQTKMLAFMRQQRCGYNPYFDIVCHQRDGRIFYAPIADSTYFDFSGGWHDAGDQLKYLITSSNATARMLLAYLEAPALFKDQVDAYGHPGKNGLPDVLDEAKWGLDWILKLHPKPDWLIHQIADDRDHRGFKYPHKDNAEYGWGPNSYRAAYFANGKPQGLGKWKSQATGVANLAGRCAAALALGARIWESGGRDSIFAARCRKAAIELFALGKEKEGFQQGNSFGAPYRYNENTWADDMEWGAAELFKLTKEDHYLKDAIHYAYLIQDDGWMARDTMMHYELYPFMNMGHYALYSIAPELVRQQLAAWYRANLQKVLVRSMTNNYQIGVPFLWCSSNLMVNFITQSLLYEKMTGDTQFHALMLLHRDWLLGRNPWGTSMFTGIPEKGETPLDVHIPPRALQGETPAGGLIDGPIFATIHRHLKGLVLNEPDEFAAFQNDFVVYHDDIGDYSTNEPTMDGTADAILMMVLLSQL
ncbi:MAG: glycoside hydrolase family 9 protein [Saprospiraceae bacterium]|nr:glycoside hydrolase family 9 protein [Saprospiraceae bacterium]